MIHHEAVLLRVRQSSRTATRLIKRLAAFIHTGRQGASSNIQNRVIEVLKGAKRTPLIDEAHQLKPDTLELLRDLHDEANVPIVLAGAVKLSRAVSGHRVSHIERAVEQLGITLD